MTRQYYKYTDETGKPRTFLLMPQEYAEVSHYQRELNWTIRQCFERQTGKHDAKDIVLCLETMDNATKIAGGMS